MTDSQLESIYLTALRAHLGDLPQADREQALEQVRTHLRLAQRRGETLTAALDQLGSPDALVRAWQIPLSPAPGARKGQPLAGLYRFLRLTTSGAAGLFVFLVALFGYSIGGGLVITALLKSFFPQHVGAWIANGGLWSIGFTTAPPPGAHELFGQHYLAGALTVGAALMAAAHLLIRLTLHASTRLRSRFSNLPTLA